MTDAYRYHEGSLVPCPDYGPIYRQPSLPPVRLAMPPSYTRRERRLLARAGGRRKARRVSRWKPEAARPLPIDFATLVGHQLERDAERVLLYLPEGEALTGQHAGDLDRTIRKGRR